MIGQIRRLIWWRPTLLALVIMTLVISLGAGAYLFPGSAAVGMMQIREGGSVSGTPVAATAEPSDPRESDPLDGDPLDGDPGDGDPLDGPLSPEDDNAPTDQAQLDIVRSGRPNQEPRTLTAYDEDPATLWTPVTDADETWVWFDLGEERRLREVRWLARGAGTVEIAVSTDRRRWQNVDRVDVGSQWQGISLRDEARYVRLDLLPDDDGAMPSIAEVAVYGPERGGSVSAEQEADDTGRDQQRNREARDDSDSDAGSRRTAEPESEAENDNSNRRSERRSSGRVRISAQPGETRCSGDRERCEARQGAISVEEDCEQDGTCTIDIRADGGTAICDASGGEESRAGDGEGRRGGDGGDCEAVANGGAVAIGDINP